MLVKWWLLICAKHATSNRQECLCKNNKRAKNLIGRVRFPNAHIESNAVTQRNTVIREMVHDAVQSPMFLLWLLFFFFADDYGRFAAFWLRSLWPLFGIMARLMDCYFSPLMDARITRSLNGFGVHKKNICILFWFKRDTQAQMAAGRNVTVYMWRCM